MIKKLTRTALILSVATTIAFGADALRFNVVGGDVEGKYNTLINKEIGSVGFVLSDPHERINDAYAKRYGNKTDPDYDKNWKVNLDNLGFFSVANDEALRELLLVAPELGGFSPFNLHIYKEAGVDKTFVGHIVPDVMLDIVGVKDKDVRTKFNAMFPALDALVQEKIGGKVEISSYKSLPTEPMMNFEITFDRPEDLGDYIDEFQEEFEAAFEDKKYIIAGYKNFREAYDDLELPFEKYDAYFVYSLCHFTFSYNVFNKGRPDAGAFAPCSMYMYIEKDKNKLVIGMPKLANWSSVLNFKDKAKIDFVNALDKEIIEIMIGLGAKRL